MDDPFEPGLSAPARTEGLPDLDPTKRPEGPRYVRLSRLGRGAMGTVHLGWDQWLQRNVALKVPTGPPGSASERVLEREARLAARLDHPAIAAIHDLGEDEDGRIFFVMRLARGARFDTRSGPEAVRALRLAADAVAHAHDRGIVHRDLSPANVLVDEHGGLSVLDWGVAAEAGDVTAPLRVGTPGHVAPEQATGAVPDPRADVWSLGVLLRDALDDSASPELSAIAAKATADDPLDRYADAGALAEDLAAWEDGHRVSAYAYRPAELLRRVVRAWRVPLALGTTAAGLLLAQGVWDALAVRAERDRAVAAEDRALASLADALAADAVRAWLDGDLLLADRAAREALEVRPHPDALGVRLATAAWPVTTRLSTAGLPPCDRWALPGHDLLAACLDEDRPRILPPDGPAWTPPDKIRDARLDDRGQLVLLDNPRDAWIVDVASGAILHHDERHGWFVGPEGAIRATWAGPGLVGQPSPPDCFAVSAATADGAWVSCDEGGVWHRLDDGRWEQTPAQVPVRHLVAQGGTVWGATVDGRLMRLDAPAPPLDLGEPLHRLRPVPGTSWLIAQGRRGRARIADAHRATWILDLPGPVDAITATGPDRLVLIRDGRREVHAVSDPTPRVSWHLRHGVSALSWTPSGHLVVGDGSGQVRRLDPSGREDEPVVRWQSQVIKALAPTPDGRVVASTPDATGLRILDTTWTPREDPALVQDGYRRLAVRADGRVVGGAYTGRLADLRAGFDPLLPPSTMVRDLAVSPDGQRLAVAYPHGAFLIDAQDVVTRLSPDHTDAIALSTRGVVRAVGRTLHAADPDGHVTSWEAPSEVTDLAWIRDAWIASADLEGVLTVWSPEGAVLARLPAHDDRLSVLAVDPTGTRLATGSWDGWIRILDLSVLPETP